MGILVDEKTRVIVQGITGREGSARAAYMKGYGTNVVAGCTPGRGGAEVGGIPVYNTVEEAVETHGPMDASVIFVPGPALKDAVLEAIDAGITLIVSPVERVPLHDILEMVTVAKRAGVKLLGPGAIGIVTVGKAVLGWLGATPQWARTLFVPGPVGVISRSGGQSGTVPWAIREAGMGMSTVVHVGTEAVTGLSMGEILPLFEHDEETRAVGVFGEIGGPHEEEAAQCIREKKFTKPLVIFVAGAWAPAGMRFSHASSIIERGKGSAKAKIEALREAGAHVVDRPEQIAPTLKRLI
ncbi:MAG: succinate--CoA ligase subunit alpha [Deltaproteobacteria bacterium]|nr:succinate--CoA ligase subunit alpha [Deltaproteobacteria bacterium]MBW2309159.1 succinate--CoA ligase subunit alpha [Deltaproteobacteria bacterium]